MRRRRPPHTASKRRLRGGAAAAALAAVAVAGCGEVKNTISPPAGTADQVTVVLSGAPDAFDAGIYDAAALGYFRQTDLDVHVVVPSAGQDPVAMVHDGQALVGVASEASVLLHRNEDEPVVGVAALVNAPISSITIPVPKAGPSGGAALTTTTTTVSTTSRKTRRKRTGTRTRTTTTTTPASTGTTTTPTSTTPTTTTAAQPDAALWPAQLQQLLAKPGFPTYDGLVLVVRKRSIVNHAGLVRRFVQAVARGYRAARAHPGQAIDNLIAASPSLQPNRALQLATLKAAIPYFFPAGAKVWGMQSSAQWNAFGEWLSTNHLLNNPNAITDASTNELLQGQGV
jgi:putative hydroxymethylpyrimidine transport system substrate-binding protein